VFVEEWWIVEPFRDFQERFLKGLLTRHPTLPTPTSQFRSSTLIAISAEER
jgi:hypothetical protein